MKHVHENSSIECESALVISRSILRSSFMEIKSIGKCTTYKCKLNSEAAIVKELPPPKLPIHKTTSFVDVGDSLECQDMFVAVKALKTLKIEVVNHSGRHKAQKTNTDSYTFAEISRQIPNIPKLSNLQSKILPGG